MDDSSLMNIRVNLEALITDREGMVAENQSRVQRGEAPAYHEDSFQMISNAIIELKNLFY